MLGTIMAIATKDSKTMVGGTTTPVGVTGIIGELLPVTAEMVMTPWTRRWVVKGVLAG